VTSSSADNVHLVISTMERYRITAKDARDQVTGMSKGGINVSRTFSADTGRIESIFAQTLFASTIQDFDYQFDVLGNCTAKTDSRRDGSAPTQKCAQRETSAGSR